MNDTLAIEIHELKKSYNQIQALRGVNLEVKRGEILGFLGPNGAGKTTTIRCLLNLIRPQSGEMRVLGIDPLQDPVAVRSIVGYLPGELNFESNLTPRKIFSYFNDLRGQRKNEQSISILADRLELDLTIPVKNLSKGNKQKVGLIQALMSKPKLLLLDEPTSGLDPLMQREVYRLLREAQSDGTTVFFSSHIISEVETIAERVAIIRNGMITEEIKPSLLADMSLRRIRLRFREGVNTKPLTDINGVVLIGREVDTEVTLQVKGNIEQLIKALAGFPVLDIQTEHLSLEETFLAKYQNTEKEADDHVR